MQYIFQRTVDLWLITLSQLNLANVYNKTVQHLASRIEQTLHPISEYSFDRVYVKPIVKTCNYGIQANIFT